MENKEVSDALHMLLHCALKDKEYTTQKGQFHIVNNYIKELENENKSKDEHILYLRESIDNKEKMILELMRKRLY